MCTYLSVVFDVRTSRVQPRGFSSRPVSDSERRAEVNNGGYRSGSDQEQRRTPYTDQRSTYNILRVASQKKGGRAGEREGV